MAKAQRAVMEDLPGGEVPLAAPSIGVGRGQWWRGWPGTKPCKVTRKATP